MRYCRFAINGHDVYGEVQERDGALWVTRLVDAPEEDLRYQITYGSRKAAQIDFSPALLSSLKLLAPVTPSKIVCVGRNYRDHVKELGHELPAYPLIFLKPPSSLLAPDGIVRMPAVSQRVDFEGELALVIGRQVRNLSEANWRSAVRGWTLANDATARDLQNKDGQWTRAKGFDSFCPVGPLVSDEIDPSAGVTIETRVNGEVRQHATTLDFIFPIPHLLSWITSFLTLEVGDIVLTGTPSGVGPLNVGDVVEISIEGLGSLKNEFQPE